MKPKVEPVRPKVGSKSPQTIIRDHFHQDKLQNIQIVRARGNRSVRSIESKIATERKHRDNSTTSVFARNLTERLRINPIFHLS